MGKDADVELGAEAREGAGRGDTSGLDLRGGDPPRLEGLHAEVAVGQTKLPLLALPRTLPRCCFRHLTRLGIRGIATLLPHDDVVP